MIDLLRALRDNVATTEPCILEAGLHQQLVACVDCLRALGLYKLDFLNRVPYKIARCRSRLIAAEFLVACDRIVASGNELHRVAAKFAHFTSPLRQQTQARLSGRIGVRTRCV